MNNLMDTWIEALNLLYGTNVTPKNITQWDMRVAFPELTEKQIFMPLYWESLWCHVAPKEGAVEGMRKLVADGHTVMVVTASHPETIGAKTREVLFKYFPFITYKDLIVTYRKDLIRGDVIIDDAPHNLEPCDCFKILFYANHNEKFDAESHGMHRAKDWEEVYTMIKAFAEREQ